MNDQELFLRVGELATASGYPLPAINRVDCAKKGRFVVLDERGAVGPVLRIRSDFELLCAPLRDVLIAEALLAARLGGRRHFQWIRWGLPWVGGFLIGVVTGYDVPRMLVGALCLWLLFIAFMAVYSRWMTRRVDDLMVEILGVDAMYEGLEHYRWPFTVANTLRWLGSGAWMVLGERIRHLRARNAGRRIGG